MRSSLLLDKRQILQKRKRSIKHNKEEEQKLKAKNPDEVYSTCASIDRIPTTAMKAATVSDEKPMTWGRDS